MASTTEQGHNRNAANFDKLIINCTSYGTTYNPSKAALKIAAIQNNFLNFGTLFT